MTVDEIPNQIRVRRQLRDYAAGKSDEVRNLVWAICGQIRARHYAVSPKMREHLAEWIEDGMAKLKAIG